MLSIKQTTAKTQNTTYVVIKRKRCSHDLGRFAKGCTIIGLDNLSSSHFLHLWHFLFKYNSVTDMHMNNE